MPLEMEDHDDDAPSSFGNSRTSFPRPLPRSRWWRPASTAGRVFLTLAALIVLGGLAASACLLKTYLGHDSRFRIAGESDIAATGLTEVSRAELLPIFGEDIGRNIFFVPLSERRRQLEQIPWIESATVIRLLPNQIRVSVVERQPVAFTRQGQQIGLVDADGVLLTMPAALMAQHHYSFPVVTGINAGDPLIARKARMAVYQRLLSELDSNGQHISQQISEIDLTDSGDARVLMPEQGGDILAHFGEDHFLARYQRYKDHIAEWRQSYPQLAAVDLRYDQQVVLQMSPKDNTAPPADDQQAAASAEQNKPAKPPEVAASKPAVAKSAEIAKSKPAPAKPSSAERKTGGDKPVRAAVDKAAVRKSAARSVVKPVAKQKAKSATKAKPLKAIGKAGKTSQKPKMALKASLRTAKGKQASLRATRDNGKGKKRVEVKRAALNGSRQKPAPTARRATSTGMGQ
jgi:cell division protein FtsQ